MNFQSVGRFLTSPTDWELRELGHEHPLHPVYIDLSLLYILTREVYGPLPAINKITMPVIQPASLFYTFIAAIT
ncbi:hypothetical protein HXA31_09150 [Salipaludibacillus agaradhaerens]|uniref:Uncharacterized protein n=1 Tax=Salipaludibacillus agaradhaerens TaxID=76935 RepID=A0A9Q4B019_SALAG|nr:hypothetical protein [Salipaludibacillus agaradhaerens]MCR6095902.1 hypothetical protein [Salipaludibacillus agaradhaerens]MCR6114539.1 hypothetical protein [Salipaludibacillus agaradhaerens]